MNGSELTKIRQNQMKFAFSQMNPNLIHGITNFERISIIEGGMPVIINGRIVSEVLLNLQEQSSSVSQPSLYSLILQTLDSFFVYNSTSNFGPTVSARRYYLFFFTIASAYSFITEESRITGVKDQWDWSVKYPLTSESEIYSWMSSVIYYISSSFGFTASPATWPADERWTVWTSMWTTWWNGRNNDGSVAAATIPNNSLLPNGAITLTVTQQQDISTYPQPTKWTPLVVEGRKRNYLTYGWGDVRSTCLSASDESTIKTSALTKVLSLSEREAEITNLVSIVSSLTDEQKIIAEFWAGGPFTITPPGMCIWFWRQFMEYKPQSLSTLFYSGLDLSIQVFECSRITWELKKNQMEARPIQEIRRLFSNTSIPKFDGTADIGANWIPYQMLNFVTPPFPDFPSGHSTFSQAFANVMTDWFGSLIPETEKRTVSNLNLLSPILPAEVTEAFGIFEIPVGSSEIQPGIVPTNSIKLSFYNWQQMAESAGVSRQYGGIHALSAHEGGQTVANGVFSKVKESWGI